MQVTTKLKISNTTRNAHKPKVFDSIAGNECLQSLIVKLSKIPVSSRVLNVQSVLRTDLVSKYDMKNFILIARPEIVNRTLIEVYLCYILNTRQIIFKLCSKNRRDVL